MRGTIRRYSLDIYPLCIWVAINVADDVIADTFGDDDLQFPENSLGYVCTELLTETETGDVGILIRFKNGSAISPDVAAHEAIHAAAFIFKYIGAVFDVDNQEPFAYLVQWVVWKIWQTKTARIE